ncbi:MAG: 5'-methylthioadenosine/adenosylhomocysteine nucleosidase [Lachnospiraceae bacterium]|nr:5'-methylthioadenosine/adenosylhomocysteine nucleosidase [Lachnospiraceae bacterium]
MKMRKFVTCLMATLLLASALLLMSCGNAKTETKEDVPVTSENEAAGAEKVSDKDISEPSGRTKIGIIAALSCELEILKEALTDDVVESLAGTEFYCGTIGNYDVVLMQCGMGKVSAGAGAQAMITAYNPDYIINTGCAGALAEELAVGDIVVADKTVEWDLDTIDIGNPRGYVSSLDKVEMTADKDLSDKICAVFDEEENVIRGMVVSGDQFVDKPEQRELILSAFPEALCAEMEGAAIGHVCEQNGVPFCVVRCMSDNANGDSGVNFAEFSEIAGEKSASYLLAFLNA